MRKPIQIERNENPLHQLNPSHLYLCDKLQEPSTKYMLLNEQLLKDKETAEQQDRLKSEFLANVVHEIRSPMNAIKGFAELLQDNDLSEDNKVKFAQIIYRSTDELLTLINDLLDISKIEAGQFTIIESSGNIKSMFNELFELFGTSGNSNSEKVQLKSLIELDPEQSLIDADFNRLKQILTNLISNALKFTEKGYVHYGCRLIDNKNILFYVEDTGIGITPDKHESIFERFGQIYNPNSKNWCKGTGLGLSIVKSLVGLMNGEIWLESAPGIGSKFYFTLPYKKSATIKAYNNNTNKYANPISVLK